MDKRFYYEYGLIIDRTKIGIEENTTIFDEDFGTLDDICDLLNKQNETIADLEAKLAESEKNLALCEELRSVEDTENGKIIAKTNDGLFRKCQQVYRLREENNQLKQQLAEKDELLRQNIGKMKSTDFIRMCKECGFMVQAKEIDNQTAIAELEKVRKYIIEDARPVVGYPYLRNSVMILNFVCDQIKELKGEK